MFSDLFKNAATGQPKPQGFGGAQASNNPFDAFGDSGPAMNVQSSS